MSFRCDACEEAQPTGVAPHRVVTRIRKRQYLANQSIIPGHEIEAEANVCTECKDTLGGPTVNLGNLPIAVMEEELPAFEGNA